MNRVNHLRVDIDLDRVEAWDAILATLRASIYKTAIYHLTKKGIHIEIFELPCLENLRRLFFDDPQRIEMDAERSRYGLTTNVLFVAKDGHKVEITRNVEVVLEWIEELKKRVKLRR